VHDVKDAIRQTRFFQQFRQTHRGRRRQRWRLETKLLPQASASGNIHIGTIAGKLNGVIPATTPSGCIRE
jgi:hypothetical protein